MPKTKTTRRRKVLFPALIIIKVSAEAKRSYMRQAAKERLNMSQWIRRKLG
jgi:hypothetical protein